jgi:hypothetical protein
MAGRGLRLLLSRLLAALRDADLTMATGVR